VHLEPQGLTSIRAGEFFPVYSGNVLTSFFMAFPKWKQGRTGRGSHRPWKRLLTVHFAEDDIKRRGQAGSAEADFQPRKSEGDESQGNAGIAIRGVTSPAHRKNSTGLSLVKW
jgi:hypothetical protein